MSTGKPSNWQVCATCTHWAGPRQVSTFRERVEYDSERVRGECVGAAGTGRNAVRPRPARSG